MRVEKTLHNIICGRTRKNVRKIEAVTNTAIYFPHPFSRILGYLPYGAQRRGDDEFFITGERQEDISRAKVMLQDTVINTRCHVKEVPVASHKIDAMILDRLEKLRRIMEVNGTYIGLPTLNTHRPLIRIQGTEQPHIDRTVREIMLMVRQTPKSHKMMLRILGWAVLQCLLVDIPSGGQQHGRTIICRHPSDACRCFHELGCRGWI